MFQFQGANMGVRNNFVKDPVLNEGAILTYTDSGEVCGHKHVNFAIATAKGSPLR